MKGTEAPLLANSMDFQYKIMVPDAAPTAGGVRPSLSTFERGSLMRASFRASSLSQRPSSKPPADAGAKHGEHEPELTGLTDAEVLEARAYHGRNEIPEKIVPLWYMIAKQLQGPMPNMIEAATILSVALLQWAPFAILLSILIINTAIGFVEEKKAKDALDGLKNSMVTTVSVLAAYQEAGV